MRIGPALLLFASLLCPPPVTGADDLDALLAAARGYQDAGMFADAGNALDALIAGADAADDPQYLVAGLAQRASLELRTLHPDQASASLSQALPLAREHRLASLEAAIINESGNLATVQDRLPDALAYYAQAQTLAAAAGDLDLALVAAVNRIRTLALLKRPDEALTVLQSGSNRLAGLADPARQLRLRAALAYNGALLLQAGSQAPTTLRPTVLDLLGQTVSDARRLADARTESLGLGLLATLLEAEDPGQATRLRRRAIFLSRQVNADDLLFRQLWDRGRRQQSTGDTMAALGSLREAVAALQRVRTHLDQGQFSGRHTLETPYRQLYFDLARLLLEIPNSIESDQRRDQRLQEARHAVELLKAVDLQDYFQDNCVTALRERTTGVDSIDPHTAVLYLVPLEDRIELLVSLSDRMDQVTVPVSRQRFEDEVRRFRTLLEKRTTHDYIRHARQLYNWLLRPIESVLARAGVTTLVSVPQGLMATVPMAALHDGRQFLVERYALATTPGLALTDPGALSHAADTRILAAGLSESVQGFPPLPNVPAEMDAILSVFDGTRLDNREFSEANLDQALRNRPYPIVHIASHARFQGISTDTFLLAYDERIDLDRLQSLLNISEFRSTPVELLTLSACQTAAGDERAALGLAGIAIKSGARSALATLWSVPDISTSRLMDAFYHELATPGTSRAAALRAAQLQVLADRRFRHPAYWAPFLMIGDWL